MSRGSHEGRSSVGLLEVEPDLAGVLSEEQRAAAGRFLLPAVAVEKGGDVAGVLEEFGAFGAIVLDGLLVQALQIGEDSTLRLIGPGSFVPPAPAPRATPSADARLFASVATRLVLLGDELLVAAHRWPWVVSRLHARMLEDSEGLARQLAICQLPRVEDRIMALMWLLAESWGRVTPPGVRLPLVLSHEVLGGLVGARRSTVTLALRKLADRGSLVSQGNGWLIVEAPATPVRPEGKTPQLLLTAEEGSLTAARDPVGPDPEALRSLVSHFAQEREGFAQRTHRTRELAEKARALREEAQRLRRERGHEP